MSRILTDGERLAVYHEHNMIEPLIILLKHGSPVARLVPDTEKVCLGRELAEALAGTELPVDEAKAWRRDLQPARKVLKAPAGKWQ